jgi:hypothetical protein
MLVLKIFTISGNAVTETQEEDAFENRIVLFCHSPVLSMTEKLVALSSRSFYVKAQIPINLAIEDIV